ncbi:MAG: hypothetical protein K2Y08_07540 [Alphaproteobacteria bacterium]|nr:hypothetical protein [Alphaproteobacteria bacterium]
MSCLRNKLVFSCLASKSLLLALLSAAHAANPVLSIELEEGGTIRAWRRDIRIHGVSTPVLMDKVGDLNRIQIGNIRIDIDSSQPFGELVPVLAAKPGIRSVALVPLLPDERCKNKINQYNEIFNPGLSLQERINLDRNLYSSLQKYKGQGSILAEKNLPIVWAALESASKFIAEA